MRRPPGLYSLYSHYEKPVRASGRGACLGEHSDHGLAGGFGSFAAENSRAEVEAGQDLLMTASDFPDSADYGPSAEAAAIVVRAGAASLGEPAVQAAQGNARRTGNKLDLVARIREARRRLAADGPPFVRFGGDFERASVPPADCDVLLDLLLSEKPGTVIEIGLGYGSSALAIAEALVTAGSNDARHVIVDAYQNHFHGSGWDAIVAAGLDSLCSLLEERSQIALPRLLGDGFVADAAFVDGSHIFHNVFVDLYYLRELVRPGGLVILDDCSYLSVATAVHYFRVNTGWDPAPIAWPTRLRAFRLPEPRTEPSFESFRPFGLDAT
jgi:predicted O-methyltransferase YrrM